MTAGTRSILGMPWPSAVAVTSVTVLFHRWPVDRNRRDPAAVDQRDNRSVGETPAISCNWTE